MNFAIITQQLQATKYAARIYEKQGHSKFRDSVTVCRNGKFRFERFCYGEAAGLVCTMWANGADEEGNIAWLYDACAYSDKGEAPVRLSGAHDEGLLFDGKATVWLAKENLKTLPKAGLGFLGMMLGRA